MELPQLSHEEIRVLGALMEKSKLTPDYYPMTVNGITAACNQKTSRWPVVNFDEDTVQQALGSLKGQSLVTTAVGGGSRAVKYKHNFTTVFEANDATFAVMCLLFLRGPQTAGEINSNSARLHEFQSSASVQEVLRDLAQRSPAWVKELPRSPGQKENRFAHLFGGAGETVPEPDTARRDDVNSRISALEEEVASLRVMVDRLMEQQSSGNQS